MWRPFQHSIGQIIAGTLVGAGLASDWSLGQAWPAYWAAEPSAPDEVITCYQTTPIAEGAAMIDGEPFLMWGFQIRVRARSDQSGAAKAAAILAGGSQDILEMQVDLDSSVYIVHSLNGLNILALGQNVPTSKLQLFTLNGTAAIRLLP